MNTKPTDIPKESRYLLDISFKPTTSTLVMDDLYWVLAMKAAKNYLQSKNEQRQNRAQGLDNRL